MYRRFLRSKDGNIAILASLVMLPAFALLGGGYDVMRATASSTKLRGVLEGAALAAASLTNARDAETVIQEYMEANLVTDPEIIEGLEVAVVADVALNSKTVQITATSSVSTSFLKMVGVQSLPVRATTKANQSKQTVELALVMDISSSMAGNKLTELKSAAGDFVEQILNERNIDETSMSLIPFGGTVNIGPLFDTYAVSAGSAIVDPEEADYAIGTNVMSGDFRFSDGDQCIEYIDADFSDAPLPTLDRPQVPHFWKWNNFNPWCPTNKSAVMFNTNNKAELISHIDGMTLSDGTGMDIGMMWGAKALSPDWLGVIGGEFADRPHPYNDEAMKVLVVMTDGEITQQFRPRDPEPGNVHSNRPKELNQPPNENVKGQNHSAWRNEYGRSDSANQQTVVQTGNLSSEADDDNAVAHFKRLCDEARINNVIVYSIGFQIREGQMSDELLQYCASDPSKYYLVEDLDIQSAFESIAASVNSLRIIG
ncbi:MAG: TadE/TadG family type IV pilus assembly protein [Pseudomonadota bacterium]